MKLLFVSSKVESRIAALEKAGKSGKNLAQKATGIIDSPASGDLRNHMDTVESYTQYGEDVDGFLQNLTDKDLRTVFNGLVEGARKGPR
jgi:hypothetical protein